MDAVVPPCAGHRTVAVVENVQIARDTYRLRLDDPVMAGAIRPGQFLMIRPAAGDRTDPLLGRPFALYDVVRDEAGKPRALDVVYLVIGRGTATLAGRRPGDRVAVWGPLGNGFGPPPVGEVILVAGGIGQTPFLALGRWWLGRAEYGDIAGASAGPFASSVRLLYGVRTADLAAGLEDFRREGMVVELATDDGSAGHHGYVTDLLTHRLEAGTLPAKVVGCGPPAMLGALTRLADRFGVACDLSLENHMACGIGVCFSCVAPIRQADGSTDLRRVCVEGPIFASTDVA